MKSSPAIMALNGCKWPQMAENGPELSLDVIELSSKNEPQYHYICGTIISYLLVLVGKLQKKLILSTLGD